MNILHIDAGITGDASVSRLLTAEILASQIAQNPDASVVHRDLAAAPLDHLTGAHLGGTAAADDLAAGQAALQEFMAADLVIIGAPMYNFTIPSQLKAWIDRLAVAGVTFRYTENGSEGLAGAKKIIVASSRGGFYSEGTAGAALDHQEAYLRSVFGFFGITDVSVIRAEGVAMGPEARDTAIEQARGLIATIAA
ncbi:FMN-dependent NADH-azoreductase [Ketogulonicigenium vulgare]|uniref:FMN-dependent NADH-azoreductase n=1 Tax=Ketogulonicigenium vulgare TaxID=92945 RepID=UPI002359E825|nr:FMN-dependent NADH-azoreductase [Ketogulonicigenium vulgare]